MHRRGLACRPGIEDELGRRGAPSHSNKDDGVGFILGAIYVILLITLGVISIRKGHWVMFIIGIFIPLFWIIGALLPRRERFAR